MMEPTSTLDLHPHTCDDTDQTGNTKPTHHIEQITCDALLTCYACTIRKSCLIVASVLGIYIYFYIVSSFRFL